MIRILGRRAEKSQSRPPFPADGRCPECGAVDWRETEEGYTRWSSMEVEREDDGRGGTTLVGHVYQDGWDDMSEGGDDHYVTCFSCMWKCELPEVVEYVL